MKITKRNGTISIFDDEKVTNSIMKANGEDPSEKMSRKTAESIASAVFDKLVSENRMISTKDVRECVYEVLMSRDYPRTAGRYSDYKK